MSEEPDFDLADQLRKIVEETDLTDPGDIAAKLLENMTREQLRSVAFGLLRTWVRIKLHSLRVAPVRAERTPSAAGSDEAKSTRPAGRRVGPRNSARARVMLTAHDRLERALAGRFSFNSVDWGLTGDLTVDQVRSIADAYHGSAKTLFEHGTNWDALAEAMVKHKATRVRDLPEDVLLGFFTSVEAA